MTNNLLLDCIQFHFTDHFASPFQLNNPHERLLRRLRGRVPAAFRPLLTQSQAYSDQPFFLSLLYNGISVNTLVKYKSMIVHEMGGGLVS